MPSEDVRLDEHMERVAAELFTDGGNNPVVRLPGRRFPGVLIQGDLTGRSGGPVRRTHDGRPGHTLRRTSQAAAASGAGTP
jgi:hypothetical protein